MQTRNNQGISVLKAICCIAVVYMHCRFPGRFGAMISYVLRFPVSIFFMISGFYCVNKDIGWIRNKAIYTLKLLIVSEVCYGMLNTLINCFLGVPPVAYLQNILKDITLYEWLLSGTLFCGPLWYLYAAVWSWLILLLWKTYGRDYKRLFWLIPVLLAIAIAGRYYCSMFTEPEKTIWLFRNAFMYGLPFMLLGMWLRFFGDRFKTRDAILLVFAGLALIVLEYWIMPVIHDFQISTIFVSVGLFLLAIRQKIVPSRMRFLVILGEKLSPIIYLSHVAWRSVFDTFVDLSKLSNSAVIAWSRPVVVLLMTVAFSWIANDIRTKRSSVDT